MSSDESDMEINCTPPELRAEAEVALSNLLPPKSKVRYMTAYENFLKWKENKKANSFSETVFLAYFTELGKTKKASTLWSLYSMIKATVQLKQNINIKNYTNLVSWLKRQSDGYSAKKSKNFTCENVQNFLNNAPDETYLDVKGGRAQRNVISLVLGAAQLGKYLHLTEDRSHNNTTTCFVEELGEHFEGDMVLLPWQRRAVTTAIDARNGLRGAAKRWPGRTVVYHIEEDDFDEDQVKLIEEGMADIANKSCITFRHKKKEDEHAVIIQGSASGCFSNVGFSSQDDESDVSQVLNLSNGCFRHGTVVHEMLHTLGFYHMQSTYNRDDFVRIVWENIKAGTEHNFAKYTNDTITDFGVQYDFDSVMHYPETAFSKNGNKTIIPLQENVKIGQREGLSESDILKLNKMYCEESETLKITHRSK